jgi:hypothetical protein
MSKDGSQRQSNQGWPVDLARLPRTPGSANAGGSLMGWQARATGGPGSSGDRRQLSLDDAPPPAVLRRTPEPEVKQQRRELPQPQKGRPQSQIYAAPAPPAAGARVRPQSQIYAASGSRSRGGVRGGDESDTSEWDVGGLATMRVMAESLREQYGNVPPSPRRDNQDFVERRPSIPIESPAPVGGRDKMPDLPRIEMEMEGEFGGYHDKDQSRGVPDHDMRRTDHGGRQRYTPSHSPDKNSRDENRGQEYGGGGEVPMINVQDFDVPKITVQGDDEGTRGSGGGAGSGVKINVFEVPGISVAGPPGVPQINVPGDDEPPHSHPHVRPPPQAQRAVRRRGGGLICGGCDGAIVGRIVNAMGQRWHPTCFTCTVCHALLEHVSSYEWEGRAYCHLDYHEVSLSFYV